MIQGGDWASTVPTECTFEARIGFFPGKKLQDIRQIIEQHIERASKVKSINYTLEWTGLFIFFLNKK
jgi:acetylornithine deacetylase/succinyl-diaminopimelate desuccinylase-like protein